MGDNQPTDKNNINKNSKNALKNVRKKASNKCCTKVTCNPQPKCNNMPLSNKDKITYFILIDIFIVLLRWSVAKPEENKFYLFYWIQIQLVIIYFLFIFTIFIYNKSLICFGNMAFYISEFFGVVPKNPYFDWMGLNKVHYWLYKTYCFMFFLFNAAAFAALILFFIVVVCVCAPYFLGYYTMKFFL
jgi:hypothetical protein